MSTDSDPIDSILQRRFLGRFLGYAKLTGPGWIQAAVTLGGGSLVGALYLGVIGGYEFMWLQPLAMLCGIIMLAAISHVTLSSKERPFVAAKKHISPVLAWGWLIATIIADVVYCAAQFGLGTDAVQNNLGILTEVKDAAGTTATTYKTYTITAVFTVFSLSLLWVSLGGGKASKAIETVLKVLVSIVVLAFMAVVIVLAWRGEVAWGAFFKGLVPDFAALFKPTDSYSGAIQATGDNASFWTTYISGQQRNIIIGAFGSAVGINMTFLMPYALMKKGWTKKHRELSRFDLALGLFVPFILATSFLVIATSAQFHAKKEAIVSTGNYNAVVDSYLKSQDKTFGEKPDAEKQALREAIPQPDKDMATMVAKRTAKDLATSLEPALGKNAQLIFGIGILAMAVSTMLVHMMMNGYAISEAFGKPGQKALFMLGASMPALTGLLSPILWTGNPDVKTALNIPAGTIATTLLPIAYLIFILLMNSKKTLGEEMPKNRILINTLMIVAGGAASFAAVWNLLGRIEGNDPFMKTFGYVGIIALPIMVILGLIGFFRNNRATQ